VTPDFSSNQNNYFGAAPSGTEQVYMRSLPGGRGANVTLVDAEYDWNNSHEDFIVSSTLITGQRYTGFGNDHGTAVLGELVGRDNGLGVIGGAPDATMKLAGVMFSGVRNVASAVTNSSSQLTVGDVILIEQQEDGPGAGSSDYVPVEWVQSVFDAISAATAAGRIVVEPAGNGSQNLDDPIFQSKFNRATRDSRAIIVGAGDANNARLSFSDYGSRVDVQAHGTSVTTTGYGDLYGANANEFYTAGFSGTSSASPIIASVAVTVQGYQKYHGRAVLTAAGMASTLKSGGSPQTGNTAQNIGPKPNLRNIVPLLDAGPPPSVSISGPQTLTLHQSGQYFANVSGGTAPFTYEWRSRNCGPSFGCGAWQNWFSTGSQNYTFASINSCGLNEIDLESRVTDAISRVGYSPTYIIRISNPC
jgi:hypothetical protein